MLLAEVAWCTAGYNSIKKKVRPSYLFTKEVFEIRDHLYKRAPVTKLAYITGSLSQKYVHKPISKVMLENTRVNTIQKTRYTYT